MEKSIQINRQILLDILEAVIVIGGCSAKAIEAIQKSMKQQGIVALEKAVHGDKVCPHLATAILQNEAAIEAIQEIAKLREINPEMLEAAARAAEPADAGIVRH